MTTFNWVNRKGLYPQVQEYLTKGKEKPLTEGIYSLTDEDLEDYMNMCYPNHKTSDRQEIIGLIMADLSITEPKEEKRNDNKIVLLVGLAPYITIAALVIFYSLFMYNLLIRYLQY